MAGKLGVEPATLQSFAKIPSETMDCRHLGPELDLRWSPGRLPKFKEALTPSSP